MPDRIRLLRLDDAPALSALRLASRVHLAPWDSIRHVDHDTPAGQRADLEAALAQHARGQGVPLAILDVDGSVAGRITLNSIVRGAFESCAMGYWLAADRTGRGLATGRVRAAVALAFGELGLHRVEAGTLVRNAASQAVLARAGFTRYGLAPRYLRIAGEWQDHVLFQRLADDPVV
ncbi:GNAT family N-acetyltransferase [Clavibacter michiganensis]|uniref:Alanine acetyltransferase n=2 Tax=Clavibacter michiganensis subsp. insidiosus TaxID=33014 RepID=A0A0D5CKN5_9MICO|nr:GNAT family protein [Clavibacter michiganensis]AJW79840.1 alanine acetyltransferase [Clavibacter michiganensis subsp. insidiosus]AWF99240.1 alanine acetyltransferase [Clavibacter michiganensis subsp. insidiosus]AWG00647.1 alanine acetyltransferase [Clavibacter michiganensis subsp. insidiosus]OQJ60745.1 alanine acetyltransferase [Clavibacter michiganensis subsp. insidiosus]RII84982.1 N-acetyltransferase [Clavibacter michiganensis subsp. insidiosus]